MPDNVFSSVSNGEGFLPVYLFYFMWGNAAGIFKAFFFTLFFISKVRAQA